MNISPKHYRSDLSLIRILATLCVVLLHTCSAISDRNPYGLPERELSFFVSVRGVTQWAVPAFFMLTGVLLLDEKKKILPVDCIKKYGKRIIFAIFSLESHFQFWNCCSRIQRLRWTYWGRHS